MTSTSFRQHVKLCAHRLHLPNKVDVVIAGVQKGATTSLHHALSHHSHIKTGPHKEMGFWNFNDSRLARKLNFQSHRYSALFPTTFNRKHRILDSTPHYIIHTEIPARILEYNPKTKFIINLRHPVKRILSAYRMCSQNWANSPDHVDDNKVEHRLLTEILNYEYDILFNDGLVDINLPPIYQNPYYLNQSLYSSNIKRFIESVPQDQLMINILEEDIVVNPTSFLTKLLEFLDVPYEGIDLPALNTTRESEKTPAIPDAIHQILREDCLRLESLLNRKLPTWKF